MGLFSWKNLIIFNVPVFIALVAIILQQPNPDQYPELNKTIHQLIELRGFKHQSHFVTTPGGYILQLVRIVNPHVADRQSLKPLLLHHGFQCSGSFFLIGGFGTLQSDGTYFEEEVMRRDSLSVGNSLGFVLASRGYDVWLANYRGNVYSTNHTSLDIEDEAFWRFNMDDMTREDLPAIIEYVKKVTNQSSIGYIGHSQGNIMMLGLLATQPQFSASIKPYIALSPVFYSTQWRGPVTYLRPFTQWILRKRPKHTTTMIFRKLGLPTLCTNPLLQKYLCFYLFYMPTVGATWNQMDFKRLPIYLDNLGFGSSIRNFIQIIQMTNRTNPSFFDYENEAENRQHYGQPTPPEYPVAAINSTDIAVIYTQNDWTNHPENIVLLKKNLKVPLLEEYAVPGEDWGHNELLLGKDVGRYVNRKILEILAKY